MAETKTAKLNNVTTWYSHNQWGSEAWQGKAKKDQATDNSIDVGNALWYNNKSQGIWRTKIKVTINSDLIVGQTEKLTIKFLSTRADTKPTHIRAFLSKTNHSSWNPSATSVGCISRSECYKDTNKTKFPYEKTGAHTTCYFIFDTFTESLKAGEDYYIYLHAFDSGAADNVDPQNKTFGFIGGKNATGYLDITLKYIEYTKCTAPSAVSATNQIRRNGSITVSWSGAEGGTQNNITKYKIYYAIGSDPTTSSNYIEAGADKNEASLPNTTVGAIKGQTIYVKIQSIGSVSGYDSDISSAKGTTSVVNSAPTKPTATLSGKALSGISDTPVDITISNFKTSTDIDGDTLSYYSQVLSEVPSTNPTSGWGSAISTDTFSVQMYRNKPVLAIKVSDGETSVYQYFSKAVNSELKFTTDLTISGQSYAMLGISGKKATEQLSVSATFSKKTNGSVQLSFDGGTTFNNWKTFSNVNSINYTNESIESFADSFRGNRISVKVVLDDGIDSVSKSSQTNLYYLASLPEIISVTASQKLSDFTEYDANVDNSIKININPAKVGKSITFTGIIKKMSDVNNALTKIEFFAKTGSTIVSLGQTITSPSSNTAEDMVITRELNVTGLEYGKNYQFGMKIYDSANNSSKLTSNTFSKLNKSQYTGKITITPAEWNIYESGSFEVNVQNLDSQDTGINTYEIYATINSKERFITSFTRYTGNIKDKNGNLVESLGTSTLISADTLQYYVSKEELWEFFKKFGIPSNQNPVDVVYTIKVKNGEKVDSDTKAAEGKFRILTRAKTEWESFVSVERAYCTSLDNSIGDFIAPKFDISLNERTINPKECLRLLFSSLPTSPNSKSFNGELDTSSETRGVKIFSHAEVEYVSSDKDATLPDEKADWRSAGTSSISLTKLETQRLEKGSYYYDLTLPKLLERDEGKYLYFRVTVYVDGGTSYQKKTIYVKDDANQLIYGRVEPPVFDLVLEGHNDTSITFKIDSEKANLDLGGLNKGFENFIRSDAGKYELIINYGSTLEEVESQNNKTTFSDIPPQEILNSYVLEFGQDFKLGNKIYYKAQLTLFPNNQDSIYSKVSTLNEAEIFYLGGSTIQVRKHIVGINTDENILKQHPDGALVVTNYNDQDKVVFKHLRNSQGIILDLRTQKIHGVILDGGSW